ncbi:slipin family protein [Oceanospirillum sediminis]|uniref:Slipin family protein n=1 Tax=Oceanospirillum sediminis TaxID=2760088 RepID=A0A839IW59_9GAMM|nr:slipin family protein [Oceanospirillum sediminis]MBB1489653.1 slipin family protein [Oceanospirillum sediminis]
MFTSWTLSQTQRGLLFKDKELTEVLASGKHRRFSLGKTFNLEVCDIHDGAFTHADQRMLAKNPLLSDALLEVATSATQAALIYKDDVLTRVIAPGERHYFWQDSASWKVETIEINQADLSIEPTLLRELIQQGVLNDVYCALVEDQQRGLLFVDGKLITCLDAGRYGFWNFEKQVAVQTIDTRLSMVEIQGQEILTKDRVSIRMNLSVHYAISDPVAYVRGSRNSKDLVYRTVQLALREAVGVQTLDQLLEHKHDLSNDLLAAVKGKLEACGIDTQEVGIKDIILPGDMRDILNQVVQAQKAAEANVIRRREETAATRSLHNTAKLLENNPVLIKLKELEALERISERIEKIQIVGGLDQVLNMSNLLSTTKDGS